MLSIPSTTFDLAGPSLVPYICANLGKAWGVLKQERFYYNILYVKINVLYSPSLTLTVYSFVITNSRSSSVLSSC